MYNKAHYTKPKIKMRFGWYWAQGYVIHPGLLSGSERVAGKGRSMRAAYNKYVNSAKWVIKGRPRRRHGY